MCFVTSSRSRRVEFGICFREEEKSLVLMILYNLTPRPTCLVMKPRSKKSLLTPTSQITGDFFFDQLEVTLRISQTCTLLPSSVAWACLEQAHAELQMAALCVSGQPLTLHLPCNTGCFKLIRSQHPSSRFLLPHFRYNAPPLLSRDESILFLRIPRAIPQSKGCSLLTVSGPQSVLIPSRQKCFNPLETNLLRRIQPLGRSVGRGPARQTRRRLQLTKTRARKTDYARAEGRTVAKTVSGGYLARQTRRSGLGMGGASEPNFS